MNRLVIAALPLLAAQVAHSAESPAAALPPSTRAFMETHCNDCHDADTARAGFRTDLLTADFTAGNTADQWKEVMDNINSGKMPPKKKGAARCEGGVCRGFMGGAETR